MTTTAGRRKTITRRLGSRAVRTAATIAASCLAVTTAACSSSNVAGSESNAPPLPEKVDSIAAKVPDAIAEKGTLTLAAAVYPPAVIEPISGGAPTGWDIENARHIAAVMGLGVEIKIIPFDGVISGLAASRYDAAAGEIYVTPERTKSVTFVTNHRSADVVMVRSDSDLSSADSSTDLCGLTLGAQRGSAEAALIQEVADKCADAGEEAVTPQTYQEQANVNLALAEGRIDAAVNSASQAAHVLSQTGSEFKIVELPWAPHYDTGLALARNEYTDELATAVKAATDHLIKNGDLQEILDRFNKGQGAVNEAKIVPALAGS